MGRLFVAIEPRSTEFIDLELVRNVLLGHLSEQEFAVLPLYGEAFPIERTDVTRTATMDQAKAEAQRILERYRDASYCVVIFRTTDATRYDDGRSEEAPVDYAMAVYPDGACVWTILNDFDRSGRPARHPSLAAYNPSGVLINHLSGFLLTKVAHYADPASRNIDTI